MTILERINMLLEERGLRASDMCKELGIESKLYYTWNYRKTEPAAKYIPGLADYFGVTDRYIITGDSGRMTMDEKLLLTQYMALNDFGKTVIKEQMKAMLKSKYYTDASVRVSMSASADDGEPNDIQKVMGILYDQV